MSAPAGREQSAEAAHAHPGAEAAQVTRQNISTPTASHELSATTTNPTPHLRVSNRLSRLRQARPGSASLRDRDMEDTVEELEARVASLESQRGVLQNKLSLARQHIMDLSTCTAHRPHRGVAPDPGSFLPSLSLSLFCWNHPSADLL